MLFGTERPKYGKSIDKQLDESLSAYQTFLLEVRDRMDFPYVLVSSATLPTIRDGQLDGEVSHLRREITATLQERTALTDAYNARLSDFCKAQEFMFIDIASDLKDPVSGVISERFRHPDPADHHLHPHEGGIIWTRSLIDAVVELASTHETDNSTLRY